MAEQAVIDAVFEEIMEAQEFYNNEGADELEDVVEEILETIDVQQKGWKKGIKQGVSTGLTIGAGIGVLGLKAFQMYKKTKDN